jgi:uncharacterized protein (TIGR02453 family)
MGERFSGFDRDAIQFFHELGHEMNRDWFEANKDRYKERWVLPMTALLEQVSSAIASAYKPRKVGAPKLFRIHRDVRFSKDKTPYKTHASGMLPLHAKRPIDGGATALYLHLGADEEYVGAGIYFFDDKQLPRWRKLVAAPKTGAELVKLVGKLRKAGYTVGGHEDYKKVPKGFAPDHPRAEYLKMRGLTVGFPEIPRGLVHKPAFAQWLIKHAKASAPLVAWMSKNLS